MLEQRDATPVDSVDPGMPPKPVNAWAKTGVGLVVAVLLLLDLLTTRGLANWGVHAVLETGAVCFALGFSARAWLSRLRAAAQSAELAHGAPGLLEGPPHIDLRLWAEVMSAMRAECASTQTAPATCEEPGIASLIGPFNPGPFANRSRKAQRDRWAPAPHHALALLQPRRRNERRERPSSRRRVTSRA
jgi:hypothetical protein